MTNELNSLKIEQFGDFEIEMAMDTLLEVGSSAATGCFMNFARFADPVSDEDVGKLIEAVIRWNFVCLYGYLFYLFILKMKYFFSKTFLFLEIVILTMASGHEKELFCIPRSC